ncbi:MAG: hypothetical protein ACOC55_02890 [Candidatus Natronoplasma sp.]
MKASDIVKAIEGDLGTSGNISKVMRWDPMSRGFGESFYYDDSAGEWVGDFVIDPGDGIAFEVEERFTWRVELITPYIEEG